MSLTQNRRDELRRNSERMMGSCAVIAPYSISPDEVLSLLDEAKAYLVIEAHLGGCVVVDSEGITHFGVRLPSPPAKDYVNTLEEFRAALAIAMENPNGKT